MYTDDGPGDTWNAAKKFYWHDACSILRVQHTQSAAYSLYEETACSILRVDHIFCAENTLCALVAWAEVVVKLPGNSSSNSSIAFDATVLLHCFGGNAMERPMRCSWRPRCNHRWFLQRVSHLRHRCYSPVALLRWQRYGTANAMFLATSV